MRLIRKYENRRMYDTSASRYVNSDDLVSMVRAGEDVRIEDVRSGRDLTRETLLQLVVEHGAGGDILSVPLLRRIIRASDDRPVQRALRAYLVQGLDLLHAQLDQAESTLWRMSEGGSDPWRAPFGADTWKGPRAPSSTADAAPQHDDPAAASQDAPPPPAPPESDASRTGAGRRGRRTRAPTGPPPSTVREPPPPTYKTGRDADADDLDALRARLDALEQRLRRA